ncbi:Rne/Rng family ribonuclease [Nocardiopsis sp. N85]|uniref:ribonuclease E/G n=1 Tax=Nocardiopsis sp. N85 TaxID=3029400 RepID=UPI00237F1039|nr:ribonuclease E/G [Nocardiopsis sp. N85]MDE3722751.1 Rne/Rng family ribonuclease [Nocardiopsis sp. N85]
MLDNEPSNGADDTVGTTETTETRAATPPTGGGEVRVTTPAPAKGVRRAAGPPPEPDDVFVPPTKPVTTLAGSGEGGTVKVTSATPVRRRTVRVEDRPPAEPVKRTVLAAEAEPEPEKKPRTTARRARAAAPDDKAGAPEATGPAADAPVEKETRTRTRRSRTRAAVTPEPEAPATPDADEETEESAVPGGSVFQAPSMLFQPPVVTAAPTTSVPSRVEDEEIDEDDDEEEEETAEATGDDETSEDRPSRRRRRRGGRGRGRSRSGEEGDDTDASTEETEPVAEETSAEDEDEADTSDEGERSGSRRRRRRRRRSGGASGDAVTDDPPNTVVRVREPRPDKPIEDEVQSVRGSTRLEAKKQRRREGREQGRRRAPIVTESEFLARREAVKRDLVIRRTGDRTQIAVLEDDILVEHYVDRATHRSYVGNVYLGRVQNVLPSMEAAFVDIGKGRNAVLYAGEVNWDSFGLDGQPKRIESVLKSGQSVLVQVTKDPIGHKGARLTSQVSLPGRYLVYVPGGSMTGISRKLPDKERARLKQILKKVMPSGAGVIVRTAAEGASEEELERDISRLANQWESIKRKSKSANAPALLNSEPDLTIRVVRDVFNEDFSSLVVSGDEAWDTVHDYVEHVAPNLAERASHWTEDRDVFAAYRIDEQINKALDRKVWLPSGGSLVIDRTEAMTVVDVNTGKFTGQGGNLEETVTKNNLEAAEEIVRQLRVRDIGGIIVIDFIDMVLESNRDLVLRRMLECLSRDRTKHQVAEVTSLGLVQMTRKRVGQGLLEAFSHTCEHCSGRGLVLSSDPAEGKGGSGNANGGGGRKKKGKADKGKAEAEQSEAAVAEEPVAEEPEPVVEAEVQAPEQPERAAEEPTEKPEPKRTRKRASRARKTTDDKPAEETAEVAPAESERSASASEAPAAEAATEPTAEEAPAEEPAPRRTRRTGARRTARAAAEATGDPEAVTETTAPAEGDEEAAERPKRRRTRRTKAAASSTAVDAG